MRIGLVALTLVAAAWGQSSKQTPGVQENLLKEVAFEQKLNNQLPLDLPFRDEAGRDVKLGDYFTDKPVLLVPVYYECPMLCNLTMTELVKTLRLVTLNPGLEFRVVMFSFDPKEKPELAAEKTTAYLKLYKRPGTEEGWTFLTGSEESIQSLTSAMGFRYSYDATIKQYAHAAGFLIATPAGKVSRYLFGIEYAARDLRLALVESSAGKIGDPVSQLLLMCFHYDPTSGRYTMAGLVTVALIGGFLILSFRREKRQRNLGAA
jgi:protein SCO1/2